jgi:DNA/RNA endonuclease G (NUC1)
VSWNLDASDFGAAPRCNCFSPDPTLPADVYHVVDLDYRNGGYDRGHMTQSESRTDTDQENAATFILSNILPQAAENNQGPWSQFENYLNDIARSGKEVYVVAGGIYAASPATLKGEGKVAIPDYTWKVAVITDARATKAGDIHSTAALQVIAVKMPNLTSGGGATSAVGIRNVPWQTYQTTVDAIEAATGYDLLSALPDDIEPIVESNDRPPVAAAGLRRQRQLRRDADGEGQGRREVHGHGHGERRERRAHGRAERRRPVRRREQLHALARRHRRVHGGRGVAAVRLRLRRRQRLRHAVVGDAGELRDDR